MGHITRRLTYLVSSRRFSLPSQFLSIHGLDREGELRVAAPDEGSRLFFTTAQWAALEIAGRYAADTALHHLLGASATVTVGSQSRVVMPRALAFDHTEERLELAWELEGGVLRIARMDWVAKPARADAASLRPAAGPGTDTASDLPSDVSPGRQPDPRALDASPPSPLPRAPSGPVPLRPDGLTLPGPVQDVGLAQILGFDPDMDPEEYDRDLADDIAEQGLLRPVVLFGSVPHRVLDGRRRLQVAQALKLSTVPALVLSGMGRDDQAKLRYLLETTSDRWAIARQLRVMARLYVNGASIDALARLLRKKKRTVQRYLRIAQDPRLVDAIERGDLSLLEAERKAVPPGV